MIKSRLCSIAATTRFHLITLLAMVLLALPAALLAKTVLIETTLCDDEYGHLGSLFSDKLLEIDYNKSHAECSAGMSLSHQP